MPLRHAAWCGLLQAFYDRDGSAFQVQEIAGGFQLLTRPEFHPWLLRLRRTANELRMTPALRETLAIVAYRQPVMRADIETVRGVHCGEILRQLMEKGLLRIAGATRPWAARSCTARRRSSCKYSA